MVALELIIAALLIVLVFRKGPIKIEFTVHLKEDKVEQQGLWAAPKTEDPYRELSEAESKYYKEMESAISVVNKLLTGEDVPVKKEGN